MSPIYCGHIMFHVVECSAFMPFKFTAYILTMWEEIKRSIFGEQNLQRSLNFQRINNCILNNKDICLLNVSNIFRKMLEFDSLWYLSLQLHVKIYRQLQPAALMDNITDTKSDGFWKVLLLIFSNLEICLKGICFIFIGLEMRVFIVCFYESEH